MLMDESIKWQEPEVTDPRTLLAGDQIGCLAGGRQLQVMTCDPDDQIDAIWVTLHNTPGETTHLWGSPVPAGNVALRLGDYDHDWKIAVLPQVWARRRIS